MHIDWYLLMINWERCMYVNEHFFAPLLFKTSRSHVAPGTSTAVQCRSARLILFCEMKQSETKSGEIEQN